MKNTLYALFALIILIMSAPSCQKDIPEEDPIDNNGGGGNGGGGSTNTAPAASFSISPEATIIADQTAVNFNNQSSGTISSYSWSFGASESGSSATSPTHVFDREGWKTVSLTVNGPLGTDVQARQVKVHAMDPNLYHYAYFSTQSKDHVQVLRGEGLKIGKLKFRNNYNNVSLKVILYHPDSWLDGIYTAFANSYWNVNAAQTTTLYYNNLPISIGNDWGIQFEASNGNKSAIRSLHYVSTYQNGEFTVIASDLYEG